LNIPENLPEGKAGDSRDIAAKKLGMSGKCMVCISEFKGYELTPLKMKGVAINDPILNGYIRNMTLNPDVCLMDTRKQVSF